MGTNYYAVRTRPTTDEPIHIGKASLGWKFLFQAMDEKYNEPPVVWNTYDQVYEWLYKHTVESNDYVIIDEYDEVISFDDFIKLVEEKQNENNKDFGQLFAIAGIIVAVILGIIGIMNFGNTMIAAKVNNEYVPLDYELKTKDRVKIITDKLNGKKEK